MESKLFFEYEVSLHITDYYHCRLLFFTKYVIMSISDVKNCFTGSPKILIHLGCK